MSSGGGLILSKGMYVDTRTTVRVVVLIAIATWSRLENWLSNQAFTFLLVTIQARVRPIMLLLKSFKSEE